jgi:WD40 repeat protein
LEDSLKATETGLALADQARKRLGWNRQSTAWAAAALTSVASLKQFWRRERIAGETFVRICQAVGLEDWRAVAEGAASGIEPVAAVLMPSDLSEPTIGTLIDWGEAPEPREFYGRSGDLATLQTRLVDERCKLLVLLGMGGMGKTTLAVRLAEQVQPEFAAVIWRSLRNAPPIGLLLADVLRQFDPTVDPNANLGNDASALIELTLSRLMGYLQGRRCLLVLDNAESLLVSGGAGELRPGYEAYSELFRRVGEARHQSCLLLTSRELPKPLPIGVQTLRLQGLSAAAGQQILGLENNAFTPIEPSSATGNTTASATDSSNALAPAAQIVAHYAGNPLALKIVAAGLRDLLGNDVATFLELLSQGSFWFSDIQDLLERHCDRLSNLEQEVIYWLAIAREPIALTALQQCLLLPESRLKLSETLASLQRRSVIEVTPTGFTMQPAVMEYVTHRFLEKAGGELILALADSAPSNSLPLLRHHGLLQASAPDYIRVAQRRWLIEPLLTQLQLQFDPTELLTALQALLVRHRGQPAFKTGYMGGNLINLLSALQTAGQIQFAQCDWQDLTLWQADLRSVQLHQVNLSRSDLTGSAFTETFSTVLSAAFSPSGQQLAHSDDRGWVHLWTVETGQPVRAFQAHQNWIFAVAWSPDGQVLACGSLDRSVSLWPVSSPVHPAEHSPKPLHRWVYHAEGVSSLAFHPQATATSGLLASGSTDQTVRLIDLATGDCGHTLTGHQGIVRAIAFSPKGDFLVSGGMDQQVGVWTAADHWKPHWLSAATPIYAVAVLPDDTIAAAGEDGRIRLWNAQGDLVRVLEGHTDRVWSLTTDTIGRLISGGDDRTIKIWDPNGDCLATLGGHQNRIWTLAVAGRKLASGGEDKTLRIWDADRYFPLQTLQGYHNATAPVAFQDGALYTLSADQVLRRWIFRGTGGEPDCDDSLSPPSPQSWGDRVISSVISKPPRIGGLGGGSAGNQPSEQWTCDRTLLLPTQGALQAAISRDIVASGSLNGQIQLLNHRTGERLHQLEGHRTWVRSVTFSPDGQRLASAGGDGTVGLWDVATGECLQIWAAHHSPVQAVAFSPDGQRLASGSWDRTVKLWDIATGGCLQTLVGHADRLTALLFSTDGTTLFSASQDGTIRQWDWGKGQIEPVLHHSSPVVAMARYDNLLASTSQDGTLRLWDCQSGDCLRSIPSSRTIDRWPETLGWPTQVIFSPDGHSLCVGGTNGTSWIWDRSALQTGSAEPLLLQVPRPYELTNITGVKGLSDAQRASLVALGAIVDA